MNIIDAHKQQVGGTWMHRLVDHFRAIRRRHPHDVLAVVFDIDGTIIDTRYLILHTLLGYDREHGTQFFQSLSVERITVHEAEIELLLDQLTIPRHRRAHIVDHYVQNFWTAEAALAGHQPYRGVMEVIRWFQLQRRTVVALNTGRPESVRQATLRSLNSLGHEYRVSFGDELLFMNPAEWGEAVATHKVAALERIQRAGMRIVAVVDNEPENLESMANADTSHDTLFLHASTIFLSARRESPGICAGTEYNLGPFVVEAELQGHVQLVLADVTKASALAQCIDSPIHWLAVPVRSDRYGRPEVAYKDDPHHVRSELALHDVLELAADTGRSVRIDLQGGDGVIEQVLSMTSMCDLPDPSLWFGASLHDLSENHFRQLRAHHPLSTISCCAEFLAPLMAVRDHAHALIDELQMWGINRFSIDWRQANVRSLLGQLDKWNVGVDVMGIKDAETMLQAALLLPRSVTVPMSTALSLASHGAREGQRIQTSS